MENDGEGQAVEQQEEGLRSLSPNQQRRRNALLKKMNRFPGVEIEPPTPVRGRWHIVYKEPWVPQEVIFVPDGTEADVGPEK